MHIPIVFQNLLGYDSHILIQGIGTIECSEDIEPIPYNIKKYMAFKLGNLRFIDSLQFIKDSLEKLVANLGAEPCKQVICKDGSKLTCNKPGHLWHIDDNRCFAHPENFKITSKHVPPELLEIYLRKGVYPYEWMINFARFNETKLPPKEAFYSKLNNSHITDEEYKYTKGIE